MVFEELLSISPYSWSAIGASFLCGVIIGLDRQLRGKPVGVSTSSLIIFGTYLFVVSAMFVNTDMSVPSRIIGQVVTGVGFLGAGVILAREGIVIGVTSAAAIWSLAAIGVCIAVVGEFVAIKLSVVVLAILFVMDLLEEYSSMLTRGVHSQFRRWRGKSK